MGLPVCLRLGSKPGAYALNTFLRCLRLAFQERGKGGIAYGVLDLSNNSISDLPGLIIPFPPTPATPTAALSPDPNRWGGVGGR